MLTPSISTYLVRSVLRDLATNSTTAADALESDLSTRSVWSIVWSCFTTIFACTWIAIHPNIPPITEKRWTLLLRRMRMTLWALFVPELIVYWALRQWHGARSIAEQSKDRGWTIVHGHFIQMGGFMLYTAGGQPEYPLEYEELVESANAGIIDWPTVTADEIEDRSKGDVIAKGLVLLQTSWFILQCIVRTANHLPVTELELSTLAFAILNGLIYFFWWNKPLDITRPYKVFPKSQQPKQTTMSPEQASTKLELSNSPPASISVMEASTPLYTRPPAQDNKASSSSLSIMSARQEASASSHASVRLDVHQPSPPSLLFSRPDGSSFPELGPERISLSHEFSEHIRGPPISDVPAKVPTAHNRQKDLIRQPTQLTDSSAVRRSTPHRPSVLSPSIPATSRHRRSKRSRFLVGVNGLLGALGQGYGQRLSRRRRRLDKMFPPFYAYALDAEEAVWHHCLWLSIGVLFGAIHCLAWRLHFPSSQEMALWRISAVAVTATPAIWVLSVLMRLSPGRLSPSATPQLPPLEMEVISNPGGDGQSRHNRLRSHSTASYAAPVDEGQFGETHRRTRTSVSPNGYEIIVYTIARITLLALSLATLRSLPSEYTLDVEWMSFIPHLH